MRRALARTLARGPVNRPATIMAGTRSAKQFGPVCGAPGRADDVLLRGRVPGRVPAWSA